MFNLFYKYTKSLKNKESETTRKLREHGYYIPEALGWRRGILLSFLIIVIFIMLGFFIINLNLLFYAEGQFLLFAIFLPLISNKLAAENSTELVAFFILVAIPMIGFLLAMGILSDVADRDKDYFENERNFSQS